MRGFRCVLAAVGLGLASASACTPMPNFDLTPDRPKSFGYKVNWLAVKTSNPASVAKTLGIESTVPANWTSGITAAYGRTDTSAKRSWVFLSPPVQGWVFVVSSGLPYPVMHTSDRHGGIGQKFDVMFSRLANDFSEVQFFGNHRVVDFVAWARASDGKTIRIFSYGDGDVYANIGAQTPEERSLRFLNVSGLTLHQATDRLFNVKGALLNEEDVTNLSALWSLDPSKLSELDLPMSLGSVGKLPKQIDSRSE